MQARGRVVDLNRYRQSAKVVNSTIEDQQPTDWAAIWQTIKNVSRGFVAMVVTLFVGSIVIAIGWAIFGPVDEQARAKALQDKQAQEAACMADRECWFKRTHIEADVECASHIERRAKYDYKWEDSFLTSRFSRYRWSDKSRHLLEYIGDKVKFQNGFGAWMPMTYRCVYDADTKSVVGLTVEDGRLPR